MSLHHCLAMAVLVILSTVPAAHSTTDCTTLVTFNTIMMSSYGNYTSRMNQIPKQLSTLNADLYCLQGYWQECDIEILVEELMNNYPYHYSALEEIPSKVPSEDEDIACSEANVKYFEDHVLQCARDSACTFLYGINPVYGTHCLAQDCADEIVADNITADCFACITRFSGSNFTDAMARCKMPNNYKTCNKEHNPSGLILVSKKRIEAANYKNLHPDRNLTYQKGYLEAEVEGLGTVVCTHLTVPYHLYFEFNAEFDRFVDQQYNEIHNLASTFEGTDHFLLGDFNTGPVVEELGVYGAWPDHYDELIRLGYRDPYGELPGNCTYCRHAGLSEVTDHIFIKGHANITTTAKRVMDYFEEEGKYGVQVQVCPEKD